MDDRPWWNVHKWPRWLWRVFVCTFPISGPLWLMAYAAGWTLFCIAAVPLAIFNTLLGEYWRDDPQDNRIDKNDHGDPRVIQTND